MAAQAPDCEGRWTAGTGSEIACWKPIPADAEDGQVLKKDVGKRYGQLEFGCAAWGRKGQSYFRIVVADSKSPRRDGRFVGPRIGNYNPRTNPAVIDVNAEQARAWLEKGAMPTDTVRSLLKRGRAYWANQAPAARAAKPARVVGRGAQSRTAQHGEVAVFPPRGETGDGVRAESTTLRFWTKIAK